MSESKKKIKTTGLREVKSVSKTISSSKLQEDQLTTVSSTELPSPSHPLPLLNTGKKIKVHIPKAINKLSQTGFSNNSSSTTTGLNRSNHSAFNKFQTRPLTAFEPYSMEQMPDMGDYKNSLTSTNYQINSFPIFPHLIQTVPTTTAVMPQGPVETKAILQTSDLIDSTYVKSWPQQLVSSAPSMAQIPIAPSSSASQPSLSGSASEEKKSESKELITSRLLHYGYDISDVKIIDSACKRNKHFSVGLAQELTDALIKHNELFTHWEKCGFITRKNLIGILSQSLNPKNIESLVEYLPKLHRAFHQDSRSNQYLDTNEFLSILRINEGSETMKKLASNYDELIKFFKTSKNIVFFASTGQGFRNLTFVLENLPKFEALKISPLQISSTLMQNKGYEKLENIIKRKETELTAFSTQTFFHPAQGMSTSMASAQNSSSKKQVAVQKKSQKVGSKRKRKADKATTTHSDSTVISRR